MVFVVRLFGYGFFSNSRNGGFAENRERTLKELNETNKKLNKTLKSAKNSLNELNSITAEIRQQRNLISKINREIAVINRRQRAVKDTIYLIAKGLDG